MDFEIPLPLPVQCYVIRPHVVVPGSPFIAHAKPDHHGGFDIFAQRAATTPG